MAKQRPFTYTSAFESVRQVGALIAPEDLHYVGELPENGPQLPFVLHLSCMVLFTPQIPFLAQQILGRLGIDCPILGGPETCCGTLHNHFGDTALEQQAAKTGIASIRRAKPTTVLSICPDCDESFNKHTPPRNTFKVSNLSELLLDKLDQLKPLMKPVNRRVILHFHDVNEMRAQDAKNILRILEAIPGLTVVPAEHARGPGVHCNILGPMLPENQTAMFEEAMEKGADTIVVPYHSCHRQHLVMELKYPVAVHHYFELVAMALDIPFEDPHKHLRLLDDIEVALDELQPKIDALGYSRDEVRPLLQWGIYNWASPARA
jgi:Fe-S oxidoreductase